MLPRLLPPLACLPLLQSLTAHAAVDFSHQIVPILKKHCAECHAGDKAKGGFSFNTRALLLHGGENGAVLEPGKADASRFIEVILSKDPDEQMPPKGDRVPPADIALLKSWIHEGITWEEGFAFKKPAYEPPLQPRSPKLPPVIDGREHPIDRIIDHYLTERKVPRPQPLNDDAFLRRANLDLIGLLPEPEVLARFRGDASPDKRSRMIEALLANDIAYAEHWLSFWNDLLRNDYGGTGFITGGRKQISHWLYNALIENKPYDQFARELLAPPGADSRGFIDGIKWRGDVSAGQTVEIQFAQSVSQSFLGINMKCASCHDSFIDRWKLDEAYGLAAIYSTRPLDIARCDKLTGKLAKASWLFPELGQVDPGAAQPERLKQLAALMTHPNNGRFARTLANRLWHRLMGHGIVHPVDAMQTEPWSADLLDYLGHCLSDNGYDIRKTLAHIATSQAYQSKAQVLATNTDERGYVYRGPRAKRMTAEQFIDAVWQITGAAPLKIDAPILRGKPDPQAVKDVQLAAQWIWGASAKAGPPAAGDTVVLRKTAKLEAAPAAAGAVITCDNEYTLFVNGREVTGDADWTSVDAVPLTTALKEGANTIVVIAKNAGNGPNPAGLFFEARVKLASGQEAIIASDATWQASTDIPTTKEGRLGALKEKNWTPATLVKPVAAWTGRVDKVAPALLAQVASGSTLMVRASLVKSDFLMRTLGRPNRDQIVSMRPNELTTLEAIDLANGQILADTLSKGAKDLVARRWVDAASLTTFLYRLALTRDPTAAEIETAEDAMAGTITETGVQDLLWALCMMPEFQFVR